MKTAILNRSILNWAKKRGLLGENPNTTTQAAVTVEEASETLMAVIKGDKPEIKDGIGDVYVTILILAKQHGWTLNDCAEHAYNQIKNRTGKKVNGRFVKDA